MRYKNKTSRVAPALNVPRRHPIAAALLLALNGGAAFAGGPMANVIVPDGRTLTNLQVNGATTNVTTSTLRGANAFNSFSHFNVGQGNTVNLHVPSTAANLINIVRDSQTTINGVLNGYKNGQIGGHVFFADPHGFVVGASGVVNVGSLSVLTPTRAFLDQLINPSGVIDTQAAQQLLSGDVPLSVDGVIKIDGKINALDAVSLRGWDVSTTGTMTVGPAAALQMAAFNGSVNAQGLEQGADIVARDGVIEIVAAGDAAIAGTLATDGANGQRAGRISVQAGGDIAVGGSALLSAKGVGQASSGGDIHLFAQGNSNVARGARLEARAGQTGDGGTIELSAQNQVTFSGGVFDISAPNGRAGRFVVDPTTLLVDGTNSIVTTGDVDLTASQSITVASAGTVTTTNSEGDSGHVILTAPTIVVGGKIDTSNATVNGKAGFVTLDGENITVSGTIDATALTADKSGKVTLNANKNITVSGTIKGGDITLEAKDSATQVFLKSLDQQDAGIDINGATLNGRNVTITANADDAFQYTGNEIANTVLKQLDNLAYMVDVTISQAKSHVTLNNKASIVATGDVTIGTRANADAEMRVLSPNGFSVGYGKATSSAVTTIAEATIEATGTVTIGAEASAKTNVSVAAINRGFTNPLFGSSSKYIDLALAMSEGDLTSQAIVGSQASIKSGALSVGALGHKTASSSATGGAYDDGTAGAALTFSSFTSNVLAAIDGRVERAGDISVHAALDTPGVGNTAIAASGSGSGIISGISKFISPNDVLSSAVSGVQALILSAAGKDKPESPKASEKFGLAASFLYLDQQNTVEARIGSGASITTSGKLDVVAESKDLLTYRSNSSVDQAKLEDGSDETKQAALSASIAVVNLSNTTYASIGSGATVNAGGAINIKAQSDVPVPYLQWGDWSDVHDFASGATKVSDLLSSGTFDLLTGLTQSYAASKKLGLTGTFNFFSLANQATASIEDGARINTSKSALAGQDVTVQAAASQGTVNFSGVAGLAFFGSDAGKTGIGGALLDLTFNDVAQARIGRGAIVNADKLSVLASTDSNNISIAEAGGKSSEGTAFNATVSLIDVHNTTTAQIDRSAVVSANGGLDVRATDDTLNINITGGFSKGTNAIGVSVAVTDISRTTTASFGDLGLPLGAVTVPLDGLTSDANGSLTLPAANLVTGQAVVYEKGSGASPLTDGAVYYVIVPDAQTPGVIRLADTMAHATAGQALASLAGTAPGGSLHTTGVATTAGTLDVVAANSGMLASAAVAGSLASDKPDPKVDAKAKDSSAQLAKLAAADKAAKARYGVSFSGDASVNTVNDVTQAGLDGERVAQASSVDIAATNSSNIVSVAGALAISTAKGKVPGIAGSYSENDTDNQTLAYVRSSMVSTSGGLNVSADTTGGSIQAFTAGVAVATNYSGLAGSVSVNTTGNETVASIDSQSQVKGSSVSVSAKDAASILSVAGSVDISGKNGIGVGAAIAYNDVENRTDAHISQSDVEATGGTLTVSQAGNHDITAVAVSVGGGSGKLAANFAIGANFIESTDTAYVLGKNTSGVKASGDLTISALDSSSILAIGGGLSLSTGGNGVGGSGSYSQIDNTISAYLADTTVSSTSGNVMVGASSSGSITTIGIGFGGGKQVGLAGSVAINRIDTVADAYISGSDVQADGTVAVTAEANDAFATYAGALGIGVNSVGFGGTVAVNQLYGRTSAHIGGASKVDAKGNKTASVPVLSDSGTSAQDARGVAVVARNVETADTWAISAGFGGGFGIGLTGAGTDARTQTLAYIDGSAEINQRNSASANVSQNVNVGAFSSIALSNQLGGIGIGLDSAGIGATVGINIVRETTRAYVDGASVHAAGSVLVSTSSSEGLDAVGIAAGAGDAVGLAGTVFSSRIDSNNEAFVRNTTSFTAGGDIAVTAQDHVYLGRSGGGHPGVRAGAAAVSGGAAAGAAVTVASVTNSTSAHITDAQTNAKGTTQVQATATQEVNNLVMGIVLGQWLGAGASVVVNNIATRTAAYIDEGPDAQTKINADTTYSASAQDVTVGASNTTNVDTRIGAVAGGFVGIGASVDVTSIRNDVSARLGAGVEVDAKRDVSVQASSTQNVASTVVAFGGGAIGVQGAVSLVTVGGLISADDAANTRGTAEEQSSLGLTMMGVPGSPEDFSLAGAFGPPLALNATTASIGAQAVIHAGGSLSIHAADTTHVDLKAGAGAIGLAGLGASIGIADLQQRVFAYADHDATLSAGTAINIAAEAAVADSSINSYVGAAGGVAIVASVAKISAGGSVDAYIGHSADVSQATGVTVSATRSTDQEANAFGGAISSSASLGASVALANATGSTTAHVDDDVDLAHAGALSVTAQNVVPDGGHSAAAKAIAGAGGVLLGVNATVANASSSIDARATIGERVQLPDGDVGVAAKNASDQHAETLGIAVGYVAVGADFSTASSSGTTEASLGEDAVTSAARSGALSVKAASANTNKSTSVAGSGGVVAGNGAEANTSDSSSVRAAIEGSSAPHVLHAGTVVIDAQHTVTYQSSADSRNAALVGASGAVARNNVTSTVIADVGDNVGVDATGRITVNARNTFLSAPDNDSASGAAGGVLVGSAAISRTSLDGTATVNLGRAVQLASGSDPVTGPGGINLVASSVVAVRDAVTLSTGGLIAGAGTDSAIDVNVKNNVAIGEGDQLASFGAIGAGTFTQGSVNSLSLVNTYGVAGIGVAKSRASLTTNESVTVADDATLTAFGNVDLTAGQDPTGLNLNQLFASANAQGYVRGLIAIPDAAASASVHNDASLTIGSGSAIGSAQNVTLAANRGSPTATADGTGHGYQLGFIPTNSGNHGDGPSSSGSATVTHNGSATAGIYHNLDISIPDCGSSGIFCGQVIRNPDGAPFAFAFNPVFNTPAYVDANFGSSAELLKSGMSATPVGAVALGSLFASGGTISVNASTLLGTGSLTSYGGPTISVTNNSPDYLLLGPVRIPNAPGGRVFFTGTANASSAPGLHISEIGTDGASSIVIHNSHRGPVGDATFGPGLFLTGDVENLGGSVQVLNDFGSLAQTATILGKEVTIRIPEGVAVISLPEPKPYYAGGNPYSEWSAFMTWPGGNPANGVPNANSAFNFFYVSDAVRIPTTSFLIPPELRLPARPFLFTSTDCTGFFCGTTTLGLNPLSFLPRLGDYSNADLSGSARSAQIYGSRVSITAKYIDVNGGISVGQPTNWSLSLPESLVAPVVLGQVFDHFEIDWSGIFPVTKVKYRTEAVGGGELAMDAYRFNNQLVSNPVFTISGGAITRGGDSLIGARYDAQANQIMLDEVRASSGGGSIVLNGGIISTNTLGRIHVNGGLGDVQVDNRTGIPLVVQNIYTGVASALQEVVSTVDITDTLQPVLANNLNNHWLYRYTPGTGVALYNGVAGSSLAAATMTQVDATSGYQPLAGLRWQWQEQATMQQALPISLGVGKNLESSVPFNKLLCCNWSWVDPDGFGTNNPWRYVATSGALSNTPQGQLVTGGGPAFLQFLSASVTKAAGFQSNWDSGDSQNLVFKGIFDYVNGPKQGDVFYPTQVRMTMMSSVKADNRIAIDFSGNAVGSVALSSNAAVSLAGNITNSSGATTLSAIAAADGNGASITETIHSSVVTKDLVLASSGGIGTQAQPFSARLVDDGLLSLSAGEDGAYVNLQSGAQLRNISAKNAAGSLFGDIVIRGTQDLLPAADASVIGKNISLTSTQGSIGSQTSALPVSAMGEPGTLAGVVNVSALRDISLIDPASHNFLAGDIVSGSRGSVSITVPNGTILNARGQTAAQALSPDQARQVWQKLQLTRDLGAETGKATDRSVIGYQNAVNRSYQEYWQLRDNGTITGTTFTLATTAVPLYRAAAASALNIASPTDEQVQTYASGRFRAASDVLQANLGPSWSTQAFDSQFSYKASTTQIADLTKNAVWTEKELSHAIAEAALLPSAGTPVGGKPNIVGGDVKLTTGGAIGKLAAPVNISIADLQKGELTDEQAGALLLAIAPGDVVPVGKDAQGRTVTFEFGNPPAGVTPTGFQIAQVAPLFVDASGKFTANSGGEVYLQSVAGVLTLDRINAARRVGLVASDSILSAGTSPTQITTGDDLSLTAGSGSIGTAAAPLTYQSAGSLVSANAAHDIYLRVPHGDLLFQRIVSGGTVSLAADEGAILATGDGLAIRGRSIDLDARGDLGAAQAPLSVLIDGAGSLGGSSANGAAWIEGSGTALELDNLSATKGITFTAASDLTLSTKAGSRIASGSTLGIQAGSLTMGANSVMTAEAALHIATTSGDMILGKVESRLANGTAVELTSLGAIRGNGDGQTNVVADQAGARTSISAASGIGAERSPLEVQLPWLQASTVRGSIFMHDFADLDLQPVTVTAGDIGVSSDGALRFAAASASGNVKLTSGKSLTGGSVNSGGDTTLLSGADMTLDAVDAGGNISLDLNGSLTMASLGGATASLSAAKNLTIGSATVKYGLDLAASNLSVKLSQLPGLPPLQLNLTGYKGVVAGRAMLNIDAPAIAFGKLWANQVELRTPANEVSVNQGYVTGWLSLLTPSVNLLMDNVSTAPRPVDVQLHQPAYAFKLSQSGRSTFTDAYILNFANGFTPGVSNFTSTHGDANLNVAGISVVDDVTRKTQFRPSYLPLLSTGAAGALWSVRASEPLVPAPEGAVNLGSSAASDATQ